MKQEFESFDFTNFWDDNYCPFLKMVDSVWYVY